MDGLWALEVLESAWDFQHDSVLPRAVFGHMSLLCMQPSCCIISVSFLVAGVVNMYSRCIAVVCPGLVGASPL